MSDREERFEKMLADIRAMHRETVERMAQLKAQEKEKTATYRQLMSSKLTYQNILTIYRSYGLLNEEEGK